MLCLQLMVVQSLIPAYITYMPDCNRQHMPAGRLYHSDSQDTLLQWRLQGDQHSDSDEEDEGDMVLDANDLNQHEELLERYLSMHASHQ